MANKMSETERASLAKTRGIQAADLPADKKKSYIEQQGKMEAKGKDLSGLKQATELAEAARMRRKAMKVLGGFEHGGMVHRTGLYELHKGEQVLPFSASTSLLGGEFPPKPPVEVVHIEPTDNHAFFIKHEKYVNGKPTGDLLKEFAFSTLDEVINHLKEHFHFSEEKEEKEMETESEESEEYGETEPEDMEEMEEEEVSENSEIQSEY